jgi:hypothetical protein
MEHWAIVDIVLQVIDREFGVLVQGGLTPGEWPGGAVTLSSEPLGIWCLP